MLRAFAQGVPPDDTVRTRDEVARGENHSSQYYGVDPPPPIDPAYARQLERERVESINRRPVTRVDFEGALARIAEPGYAGHVSKVVVRRSDGSKVRVDVRDGKLWPGQQLRVGEKLTVEVTVHRPGWAGWLVGDTAS